MAELARPFPPGRYPVVVIGSGPGGLQTSYALGRLGVEHAVLSQDDEPGGMFRRFPIFQRLISWTKPYSPAERGSRAHQRYDWNTLLADEPEHRAGLWELMDGSSYFPSRPEMQRALETFAERAGVAVRYGCRWTATRRDDEGFTVETTDGEYACRVLVLAVGATEPWKPDIPGMEHVPHYAEVRPPEEYADKRVVIIGKRNSGFEVADGLLPWARQIVLISPRPATFSVMTKSLMGARARYLQPYEDHVLGGGTLVFDAAIERVRRAASGWEVETSGTTIPGAFAFEADDVIATTGFGTPLLDLPGLGVPTVARGRIPAQTPWWESVGVPGIYFAGNASQGATELKKYGLSSNSAAVQGARYNALVLARHIAETHFGAQPVARPLAPGEVIDFLLHEVQTGPALWNQQSYLARVVSLGDEPRDLGIQPLAHFVDQVGEDAVAVTIETDDTGDIHPAAYVRRGGSVDDRALPGGPTLDFGTAEHRRHLAAALEGSMPR